MGNMFKNRRDGKINFMEPFFRLISRIHVYKMKQPWRRIVGFLMIASNLFTWPIQIIDSICGIWAPDKFGDGLDYDNFPEDMKAGIKYIFK